MFDWYGKIKKYYNKGLWTEDQVRVAVTKNKITESEFEEITGITY
jgi:uncharacterized XkdX family phage protein